MTYGIDPIGYQPTGYADIESGTLPSNDHVSTQAWSGATWAGTPSEATWATAGTYENVLFMTGEISDAGTIEAGETVQMAVANLQNQQPAKKWRSSEVHDYLEITLDEPLAANALAINASNLAAGFIRVRAYTTAANLAANTNAIDMCNWTSPWPLGNRPQLRSWPRYLNLVRWTNAASAFRFWRVDIADSGAAEGYLEAGRFVLDRYWRPTINADFGSGIQIETFDVQTRSPWGNLYTDPRRSGRSIMLKFSAAEWRDAFDIFSEMQRRRGQGRDVIVFLDPAETTDFQQFAFHGLITSVGKIEAMAAFGGSTVREMWTFTITISELLD